jgi:hypothetical protein
MSTRERRLKASISQTADDHPARLALYLLAGTA